MAYENEAAEHERLMELRFELQRKYDACPKAHSDRRAVLRTAIADIDAALERLRQRHRRNRARR